MKVAELCEHTSFTEGRNFCCLDVWVFQAALFSASLVSLQCKLNVFRVMSTSKFVLPCAGQDFKSLFFSAFIDQCRYTLYIYIYVLCSADSLRHFMIPWLGNQHIPNPLPLPLTQKPKNIHAFIQFKLFVRIIRKGLKSITNNLLYFRLSVCPH